MPAPATPSDARIASVARIGRNFSFRMAAQVLSAVINVGAMVLLGNHLNAAGYGEYVFYYALIPLLATLADLGAGIMITKAIARERLMGPRYYGDALIIKLAIGVPMLVIGTAAAWLTLDAPNATLVTLVLATSVIDFSQDVTVWIVRAHERLDLEAILLLVSQVVRIVGMAAAIMLDLGMFWLLGAATAGNLVRIAIGVAFVRRRFYRPVFELDMPRLRALMKQAIPFGVAMFGVVLYGRIGVLMLKSMGTSADVALFNVGYMLSQPLGFISTALSMAAFPVLARRAQRGEEAIRDALRRTSKYQLLVTLPLMVGLFLLAQRIIPLLFHGADFARAGTALRLMSLGLVFIFVNLMSRYVLAAIDREQVYLRSIVAGLIANLGLGALLIPRFGFAGACIAQLGGETAVLVICQAALSRYVPVIQLLREAVRPVLAALGMGVVVWLLRDHNLFLAVGAGAVSYVALLFAFQAFTADELRLMRGVAESFGLPRAGAPARRP